MRFGSIDESRESKVESLESRSRVALSPLGERVARIGAFISRCGPGEGVRRTARR